MVRRKHRNFGAGVGNPPTDGRRSDLQTTNRCLIRMPAVRWTMIQRNQVPTVFHELMQPLRYRCQIIAKAEGKYADDDCGELRKISRKTDGIEVDYIKPHAG
ncbi:hypothetical protein D3C80_859990 [compost metagenome]